MSALVWVSPEVAMWSFAVLAACSDAPDAPPVPGRPVPTSSTSVPTPDASVTDVFLHAPRTVDLLFVVDDSASMAAPQSRLAEAAPHLVNGLLAAGADWHVGVVSTDLDDPARAGDLREVDGLRWIDADTPSALSVFAEMVSLGTAGSETEQGLGAIRLALDGGNSDNAGFLRDDSGLHVVVVSDEDDHTVDLVPEAFAAWFHLLRDEGPWLSAIVPTTGAPADEYLSVAAQAGGVVLDVDTPSYAAAFADLGASGGAVIEYFLSALAAEGTVEVSVEADNGATLTFAEGDGVVYDAERNSVRFVEFVPSRGYAVTVTYERRD